MTSPLGQALIESQGDHEYAVSLSREEESAQSWVSVTPEIRAELDVDPQDEEGLVRRAVELVARCSPLTDLPAIITLEDVIAAYPNDAHSLGGL